MSKQLVIKKVIKECNECPFFYEHVDYSVCEDSFDHPNFDWYCQNKKADNSNDEKSKWNGKHGKFIGGSLSPYKRNCSIPKWCPLKDDNLY